MQKMPRIYKLLLCLSISAIFFISYGFKDGENTQATKTDRLRATKMRKKPELSKLTENDDIVAAILIMPKSYLPALDKFSNSTMAKDMTILKARLEFKDGQMTAVSNKQEKKRSTKVSSKERPAAKPDKALSKSTAKIEKKILATGFVLFLANIHRGVILH